VGTQVSGWAAVDSWAIMACDRQASALRSAGWSDERIFEEEHKIAVRAVDRWDVEFTVDDYLRLLVEGSHWFTEIVCEPGPGTPAGQSRKPPPPPRPPNRGFAVPFQISAATVSVRPARASGPCPMELAVAASLTAVGGGTASFRMVHNGAPGPVRKVTFSQGGTRTDTATFTVGAPSGGPAFAAPTGSGGGIGGLQTPTQPGQHNGHFAIQVVAPNALASDEAFYSVTCTQPPAPQGLKALGSGGPGAGSAGLQPGPPVVELSPARGGRCPGARLEIAAGAGAAPRSYQLEWQRFQPARGGWEPRPVAGFGQLAGPTVDAQVPRRALGAGGRWQVRARSLEPPGPWSGWAKLLGDWDGDC
jgi:hypothetical protein